LRAASLPGAAALTDLTEHYGAARFGEREFPDTLAADLERALTALEAVQPPTAPSPPPQTPAPPAPSA
jgi:hypothetical protein